MASYKKSVWIQHRNVNVNVFFFFKCIVFAYMYNLNCGQQSYSLTFVASFFWLPIYINIFNNSMLDSCCEKLAWLIFVSTTEEWIVAWIKTTWFTSLKVSCLFKLLDTTCETPIFVPDLPKNQLHLNLPSNPQKLSIKHLFLLSGLNSVGQEVVSQHENACSQHTLVKSSPTPWKSVDFL